jgi:hypothetical protein
MPSSSSKKKGAPSTSKSQQGSSRKSKKTEHALANERKMDNQLQGKRGAFYSSTKRNNRIYDVLPQPIRHELNKYFFDVNSAPDKKQRKKLLHELWLIDPSLTYVKLVKWFQNKRNYCKRNGVATTESDGSI